MEELNQTVNLNMTGFDLSSIDFSQLYNTSHFDKGHQIIFDTGEQVSLIGAYVMILILGLTFNGAIIWVILGKVNKKESFQKGNQCCMCAVCQITHIRLQAHN